MGVKISKRWVKRRRYTAVLTCDGQDCSRTRKLTGESLEEIARCEFGGPLPWSWEHNGLYGPVLCPDCMKRYFGKDKIDATLRRTRSAGLPAKRRSKC
jgi:hypothetical protein